MTVQGDGSEEYQETISDLNDSFRRRIRGFAKWCAANWSLNDMERREQKLTAEYQRGWNAAMEAVDAAADSFLEEYHQ